MHPSYSLLATLVACLPTVLAAQGSTNLFEIYPPATTASARGMLGTAAGELLQEVPSSHFVGVGDGGATCTITGMSLVTQDENPSTPETYSLLVRARVATGMGPDPSAGGVLLMAGPYSTPSSGQTTPTAFAVTVTLGAPAVLPCGTDYFMGIHLSAAPGWATTDGQSVWTATYADLGPPYPNTGDNPRVGAPNHAWQIVGGMASQPSDRVLNLGLITTGAVLNIGNVDPLSLRSPNSTSFGAGGMYPDVKGAVRDDGLVGRIRDSGHEGGLAFLFVSLTVGAIPLPPGGTAYLRGTVVGYSPSGARIIAGEALQAMGAPRRIPAAHGVSIYLQALTFSASLATFHLTNMQAVSL